MFLVECQDLKVVDFVDLGFRRFSEFRGLGGFGLRGSRLGVLG